jgi:hypothetical protein
MALSLRSWWASEATSDEETEIGFLESTDDQTDCIGLGF